MAKKVCEHVIATNIKAEIIMQFISLLSFVIYNENVS